MAIKYGSPTFILRNECKQDLPGVLSELADRGFEGIELYGMFGYDPQLIQKTCERLGLTIICDHIPYAKFVKDTREVIDAALSLDTKYLTIDEIPEDRLPGTPLFSETLNQIKSLGALCRKEGIQLLYHNQGFDVIRKHDGRPILEALLDNIAPEHLKLQIDLGWLAIGGESPSRFLVKYRDRCPIIHLKDYYATGPVMLSRASDLGTKRGGAQYNGFEFRPTGYGIMDFASLMPKVLACDPDWLIADHDLSYDQNNSLDDLEASLRFIRNLTSFYQADQVISW